MNHERTRILEQLQAQAEDLLHETPTLFAYGTVDPLGHPALRDVQLCAYMDPALPAESYFHVEIRLEALLEEALQLPVAGARILNHAPVNWQGAFLEAGRVVFSRDEPARVAFEEGVRRAYFDLKGMLAAHARPAGEAAVAIRTEEIQARLQHLDDWIARLRECGGVLSSDAVEDAAVRYMLQSAVSACLAVCLYVISALKLRPPRDITDIPGILAEVGVLEEGLARDLVPLIEIRHRLIHRPAQEEPALFQDVAGALTTLEYLAQVIRAQFKT
jgi:uncharacterized protein YutE (UPF0331/DUF86 family)